MKMHPYGIIKKLEQTPKTNDKLKILKSYKHNEQLKEFFYMALEPSLVFGIKKIPNYGRRIVLSTFAEAMRELYKFSNRELTGNAAKEHLTQLLSNIDFENGDLIQKIIKKDPDCKVAGKMVNKVWPDLITMTPYMRCSTKSETINYPAYAQLKANGLFINAIKESEKFTSIRFLSRNGLMIDLLGNLIKEMTVISKRNNFVILGEGLVKSKDGFHILDRKTGNGIINKAIKHTITEDEASRVFLSVWDIIPLADWKEGKCNIPYDVRFERLSSMVEALNDEGYDRIGIIDTRTVENYDEAEFFFDEMIEDDQEGAVLKNAKGIWKDTSSGSKDQVKMKLKDPADLICVGTIPHTKNPVWIGSLVLESSDEIIKVSTGSGLTEGDRQEFPEHYIGKIIEMEYNEITSDKKTKQKSLYLPIYKGIRFDKDEADSYALILERAKANRKKGK
jgi:ATP-dependent DNA ligase